MQAFSVLQNLWQYENMILIIDGYNLLFNHHWPAQGNSLEEKRENLIKEVALYKRNNHVKRVILVFDGRSGGIYDTEKTNWQGIEIYYATCEGKADEKIISLCSQLNDVEVVTADRRLAQHVKSLRCRITPTDEFIANWYNSKNNTISEKTPNPPKGDAEVNQWLECFNLKEEIEIPEQSPKEYIKIKKKKNMGWQ